MSKTVEIQNFSIVLLADNQSPSIINPDFLKYNNITPPEWELAMPSISTPAISQILFTNGVNIVAEQGKITFFESFDPNNFLVEVPDVSLKYVETLPYISYQAIGLNLNGHVTVDKEEDAKDFMLNCLIAPGAWKNFRGSSPDVVIQFVYPSDNRTLTVTVQHGSMQMPPVNESIPILIFGANFNKNIVGNSNEEKTTQVKEVIKQWEEDFNTFRSLVEETFMSGSGGKVL